MKKLTMAIVLLTSCLIQFSCNKKIEDEENEKLLNLVTLKNRVERSPEYSAYLQAKADRILSMKKLFLDNIGTKKNKLRNDAITNIDVQNQRVKIISMKNRASTLFALLKVFPELRGLKKEDFKAVLQSGKAAKSKIAAKTSTVYYYEDCLMINGAYYDAEADIIEASYDSSIAACDDAMDECVEVPMSICHANLTLCYIQAGNELEADYDDLDADCIVKFDECMEEAPGAWYKTDTSGNLIVPYQIVSQCTGAGAICSMFYYHYSSFWPDPYYSTGLTSYEE